MNNTLTIKLTRAEKAAAKRLLRLERWRVGLSQSYPYAGREHLRGHDRCIVSNVVVEAVEKAGAK